MSSMKSFRFPNSPVEKTIRKSAVTYSHILSNCNHIAKDPRPELPITLYHTLYEI